MAILFALTAAFCFASLGVTVKRGLQRNTIFTALTVAFACAALVTALFTLAAVPEGVTMGAVMIFIAAGVAGEGVGRISFLTAVHFLGPSRATPIQTATYPVLSLIGGVILFSEAVTVWRAAGAAAIVAGIWAIASDEEKPDVGSPARRGGRSRRWVYFLPVLAGIGFAVSDLVRKTGMAMVPHPAFGAMIGACTVLVIGGVVLSSSPRLRSQVRLEPGWHWFLLSGVLGGCGVLLVFMALERGEISVVGPIIMAQPMMVVLLSAVFLRGIEKLTWRLVAGVALTVLGVITISFSGS